MTEEAQGLPVSAEQLAPVESDKTRSLAEARAKFNQLLEKQKTSAPAKSSEEAKEPEEAKAKEDEAKEVEKPEPVKRAPEAEKLRAKLLLAGNPKKAVEALSDDELSEWWKKQEEREQAVRLSLQRTSELEKQLEKSKAAVKSEPLAGVPTDDTDLEDISADLSDQFGQEESAALVKALKAMTDPLRKENEQIKAILDQARKTGVESISKKNRDRLAEKLSFLKDNDKAWAQVRSLTEQAINSNPGVYETPEAAFDSVFSDLYGDVLSELDNAKKASDPKTVKARISASIPETSKAVKRDKESTSKDAARAAYLHLQKNPGDVDGARREFGRLQVQ